MIGARSCAGVCSSPSETRSTDIVVQVSSSSNERSVGDDMEDAEEKDSSEDNSSEEGDAI
jgi:hypothetical protein